MGRSLCRSFPVLTAALVAGLVAAARPAARSEARPHILLIHADDLGWRDLGCYGAAYHRTPEMDTLAREGFRFTDAYAGGPVCTPARAALVTGLHAARLHTTGQPGYKTEDTSARRFAHPDFRTGFPVGTPTVARTLGNAGYHTVNLGKWGFDDSPIEHGFVEDIRGSDEALVGAALAFLARRPAGPFFVYLNFSRPHVPLHPDPALVAAYAVRPEFAGGRLNPAYAAEVELLDRDVGRVLAGLVRHALVESTLVIFTSDNGGFMGYEHERIASNSPLREGKASLYEGGLRVPLIVRWPGIVPSNATSEFPVHGVDWHATLADVAGLVAPPGLDGQSFAAVLRGASPAGARPLFWHYPHYRRAMPGRSASPSSAVRDGDWKLIHFYETDEMELYCLRDDPGETRDLAAAEPARAAALRRKLDDWRRSVGSQSPVPNPRHGAVRTAPERAD